MNACSFSFFLCVSLVLSIQLENGFYSFSVCAASCSYVFIRVVVVGACTCMHCVYMEKCITMSSIKCDMWITNISNIYIFIQYPTNPWDKFSTTLFFLFEFISLLLLLFMLFIEYCFIFANVFCFHSLPLMCPVHFEMAF